MSEVTMTDIETVREELVNAVTGHMPGSGECSEGLIRQAVRWGFDRVILDHLEEREALLRVVEAARGVAATGHNSVKSTRGCTEAKMALREALGALD